MKHCTADTQQVQTGPAVEGQSLKSTAVKPHLSPTSAMELANKTADIPAPSLSDRTKSKRSHDEMEHPGSAL